MSSLPQVAQAIQTVLTDLPDDLGRATGFLQRRSKLTPARFVQTLVLGCWQHPDATLGPLSHLTAVLEPAISPQGLDQRLGEAAADLLRARLETAVAQVITADPLATGVLARFPAVVVLDSTTVSLPDALATIWAGCGGRGLQGSQAALKLTVRQDLVGGGVDGPTLRAGRTQDKHSPLHAAPLPSGALRLADQGFWSREVLTQLAATGYFLSRLHCQTTVFVDGVAIDLGPWLRAQAADARAVAVTLGKSAQVPARLLARRLPQEQGDRRRAKLRAAAPREGQTPSGRALALAEWTLLVTTAPPALLGLDEALVLGRGRWQIEVLFKLWKSGGKLATSRSANPWRVLCEVYATLIALVLQHWVLLVSCWHLPDRSMVRDAVLLLALGLPQRSRLIAALTLIGRQVQVGCKIDKRHAHPSAFQLLDDPSRCYA